MTRHALVLMIVLSPAVSAAAPIQPTLQPGTPSQQVALPPIPPGNVLFRLNGTRAITERVFPTLANASGALNQDIESITLVDREATLGGPPLTTGVAVKTWATDVKLRVHVSPDDWTASFRSAGAQRARVESNFALTDATLEINLHVRTRPITPLDQFVPGWIKQMANVNDTFTISLGRFGCALNVVLERAGNGVAIDSADGFQLNIVDVTVSDSAGLTDIASAVLGFDRLFNVAARMDDVVVGTTQIAPTADMPARAPITRVPLDISTLNATAAVSVFLNLKVTQSSGVVVEITSVLLDNLAGQLRVGPTTTELAPHRSALQSVITTPVRNRAPQQPLIARSVGIVSPLRAVMGQPSYGPAYVRLPINIVVQ